VRLNLHATFFVRISGPCLTITLGKHLCAPCQFLFCCLSRDVHKSHTARINTEPIYWASYLLINLVLKNVHYIRHMPLQIQYNKVKYNKSIIRYDGVINLVEYNTRLQGKFVQNANDDVATQFALYDL